MKMKSLAFTLLLSANVARGLDLRNLVGAMREKRAMEAHHHDASTGTVTEVTKEQQEAGHAALTCDTIMAKSLVLSNEQKAHAESARDEALSLQQTALTKIATLEELLSSTTEALSSKTKELEAAQQASADEKKAAVEKYDRMVEKMTGDSEQQIKNAQGDAVKTIEALKQKITDIQADSKASIGAAKAEWEVMEASLKSDAQAEISRIQAQSKETILKNEEDYKQLVARILRDANQAREDATAEMKRLQMKTDAQIKEIMKKHDEENEEKDAYAAKIKKEAEEIQATMKNDHEVTTSTLEAEKKAAVSSLQTQHDDEILDLKVQMADLKEKAQSDFDASKKEARAALEDAEKKAAKVLSTTKSEHTQAINDLTNTKISLEKEVNSLDKRNKNLAKRLKYADKALANWEELHGSRSYCNFTYIHEDSSAAVLAAVEVASEKIGLATGHASRLVRQGSEPHLQKTRELYDLHLKDHIDKYVIPMHEAHLSPLIKQAVILVGIAIEKVSEGAERVHQRLVDEFKALCPQARRDLTKMEAPLFLIDFTKQQCRKPRTAVNRYLRVLLIVFVLVFRKALWKLVVLLPLKIIIGILRFPFTVAFAPLRLLFPSKSSENCTSFEVDTLKEEPEKDDPSQ